MIKFHEKYKHKHVKLSSGCWEWLLRKNSTLMRTRNYINLSEEGITAHRLVLEEKLGRKILPGAVASHTCNNVRCVNPEHIIEETQRKNVQRSKRFNKGATFNYNNCKWQCQIRINGKLIYLGQFLTQEEAQRVYLAKLEELGEKLPE